MLPKHMESFYDLDVGAVLADRARRKFFAFRGLVTPSVGVTSSDSPYFKDVMTTPLVVLRDWGYVRSCELVTQDLSDLLKAGLVELDSKLNEFVFVDSPSWVPQANRPEWSIDPERYSGEEVEE